MKLNFLKLLPSLLILNSVYSIPAFNTINDFDLDGNVCPRHKVSDLKCNILCVKDLSQCPEGVKLECADGQVPCGDGACHSSCDGIKNICSCLDDSTDHVPCSSKPVMVDIDAFDPSIKNKMLANNCGDKLNTATDLNNWSSGINDEKYWAACPPAPSPQFTFTEPMWISVFSILGSEILLILIWAAYKRIREGKVQHMYAVDTSPIEADEKKGAENNSELEDEPFPIKGFVNDFFGTFMLYSFLFISVGWIVYLAVITADYYGAINGKLYGIAHENYDLSSSMFIGIWIFATTWFVVLNVFRFRLRNFFRIQVKPLQAQYIQIEQPQIPTILLDDGSQILAKLRQVEQGLKVALGANYRITSTQLLRTSNGLLYFNYQCRRYVYNDSSTHFQPFDFDLGTHSSHFLKLSSGLSTTEANRRLELKGPNFIEVYVPSFVVAFLQEFTSFFYLYQLMIMWLFYYLAYYKIGLVDTAVIFISALIKVVVRLKAERRVKKMAEHQDHVKILRDGEWSDKSTADLVPGDIFQVENNKVVPCDAILISGNIVADESSLTGEPLPIRKFPVKDEETVYDRLGASKINSLFSGTTVVQTTPSNDEQTVTALVYQTSTSTDKGQLVYKILFPNPISFIFDEQLKVVIIILAIWGVVLFCLSLWLQQKGGTASWFYGMFCLSQILSPILPAALVVGQSVASNELRKKKIFCVDLPRIMIAGKVQIFCFDKTGTLTKEGLEFYGGQIVGPEKRFGELRYEQEEFDELFQLGLASCHSVTQVNGTLIGNPVDIEMFTSTKWKLLQPPSPDYVDTMQSPDEKPWEAHIVKRFEFVHARASMSVAVLDSNTGHVHIFVKGSFEKLKDLSNPASIPNDYDNVTNNLAKEGCYVLALAHRDLGKIDIGALKDMSREELEKDINLLGLIVFKNLLKEDTEESIRELKEGNTRTVMITGDTALTGVYIAKACSMMPNTSQVYLAETDENKQVYWVDVDEYSNPNRTLLDTDSILSMFPKDGLGTTLELAMTGKAFNELCRNESIIRELVLNTRVFARMTPQDKVDCINLHMERGVTAMCGDGGNDCGALRAAHVGIALSEAEASIVSPFSSSFRSVASCVELLRQGRAALATSFAGYKYLIMYGEIMAWLKIPSFYFSVSVSENIWIAVDAFIAIGMTLAISQSKAAIKLSPYRPTARLLGPETLCSTIGQVLINTVFLIGAYGLLYKQPFFKCKEFDGNYVDLTKWYLLGDNFEGQTLGFVTLFQFVNAGFIYNFGYKFRRAFFRNYSLMLLWATFLTMLIYMLLADPNRLGCLMRLNCGDEKGLSDEKYPAPDFEIPKYNTPIGHNIYPHYFRYVMLGLCLGNMACSLIWEAVFVLGPVRSYLRQVRPLDRLKLKL
ncbi:hypothetical protein K502DRAFT_324376 [Neoconidiobolus thromboides FSU 785]|nr:hypothetical protein K502DRAFT_324376 [Neoconidiobolus thromboides FSU 785]